MNEGPGSMRNFLATTALICMPLVLTAARVWAQESANEEPTGFFEVLLMPRVWVSAIFCLIGLALLAKSWVSQRLRLLFLPVIFFAFALLWMLPLGWFAYGMGPHPSPLCVTTKPFLFAEAGYAVPVAFLAILAAIAVLCIIGNKLYCGWVCPIGSLQEICHRIPLPGRLKPKLPFMPTNVIRTVIFITFLVVVILVGPSIYDFANPFEMLHWSYELGALVALLVTMAAAVFLFRPFCYLVCPLGLLTWVLEHLSIVKVKVDKEACTECDVCIEESPCPAVRSILDGRVSRPDCHACGRCIESCPEDALKFRL